MKKLLVCISSALLVAGCASQRSAVGGAESTSEASTATTKGAGAKVMVGGSANSQLVPEDARFVREAAQAGVAEVKMGDLVMQNSQDTQLKTFGQRLINDHTLANQELQQLAIQKGMELPTVMAASDIQMMDQLSHLNGPEFDREVQQHAVKAHEKAIKLFQNEAVAGQDPDLKAFAQKTLPVLQQHLSMARQLNAGTTIRRGTLNQ